MYSKAFHLDLFLSATFFFSSIIFFLYFPPLFFSLLQTPLLHLLNCFTYWLAPCSSVTWCKLLWGYWGGCPDLGCYVFQDIGDIYVLMTVITLDEYEIQ